MSTATYPVEPGVRSILALRPNAIGDFMFSLPALHALRHSYPQAKIVLLGKQWHAEFLHGRPGPIDEVIVMPPFPGVGAAPDAQLDPEPGRAFVSAMREAGFDLAVQMYGGGRYSNAFIMRLGARLTIGAKTPEAAPLDRSIAYGDFSNRRLELLQVVALAGAQPYPIACEVEVTENDRRLGAEAVPDMPGQRLVVLHPGASDPRRRWPAERYAAVADALASRGALIAISGTGTEAALAQEIIGHMRHGALDLTGGLSLPALCGLLERAVMMISNDTGPLHLARAGHAGRRRVLADQPDGILSLAPAPAAARAVGAHPLSGVRRGEPQDPLSARRLLRRRRANRGGARHGGRAVRDARIGQAQITSRHLRPAVAVPVRARRLHGGRPDPRRSGASAARAEPSGRCRPC